MWRCQREKLKEDAIPCCGNKECEQIYLDSFPEGFDFFLGQVELDYYSDITMDFKKSQFRTNITSNGWLEFTLNGQSIKTSSGGWYDDAYPTFTINTNAEFVALTISSSTPFSLAYAISSSDG